MPESEDLDGESTDVPPPWGELVDDVLRTVVPQTMPSASLGLYARWWQLETWLRELAYVELRAQMGSSWTDAVREASGRQRSDAPYTHMTGADNDNPLAYLDYSQLIKLIEARWDLFEYALIEKGAWTGRQSELLRIRHRIGHLRRPHRDDLGRLEQTLRDLERGAFVAQASYGNGVVPSPDQHQDPITNDWIGDGSPQNSNLIEHARAQYNVHFSLTASCRPWATWPSDLEKASGILWHASFTSYRRAFASPKLWHESNLRASRPTIVHMLTNDPGDAVFTFSGTDDSAAISAAIYRTIQAVLANSALRGADRYWDDSSYQKVWQRQMRELDYRVLVGSGWSIIDELTVPISYFGAGGGVTSAPTW